MNDVLKPCPLCGGQANVIEHRFHGLDSSYGLQCKKCKAETYQFYESEEKAIEAWNRRAGDEYSLEGIVTHWMPMPEPPEEP